MEKLKSSLYKGLVISTMLMSYANLAFSDPYVDCMRNCVGATDYALLEKLHAEHGGTVPARIVNKNNLCHAECSKSASSTVRH